MCEEMVQDALKSKTLQLSLEKTNNCRCEGREGGKEGGREGGRDEGRK